MRRLKGRGHALCGPPELLRQLKVRPGEATRGQGSNLKSGPTDEEAAQEQPIADA
jgi:hypothetical protein